MFNPEQASRLKGVPIVGLDDATFEGKTIKTVFVEPRPAPLLSAPSKTIGGSLYSPAKVFGTPYDTRCLDGVGSWPVHTPNPSFATHESAKVIGFCSVLTEDNRLLIPDELDQPRVESFLKESAYNHYGYSYARVDGGLLVRYAARKMPQYRNESALFLHNIEPGNYGSFMFRQLPQLLLAAELRPEFDCYILPDRSPWLLEAMRIAGMPDKHAYSVSEVCGDTFKSVAMSASFDAEGFLDVETRRRLGIVTSRIDGTFVKDCKRIYVSRSLSSLSRPYYRVMRNELDVEALAQSLGFTIVYPETLSFVQQIRTFCSATHVIGPSGSGMFNACFAKDAPKIVDIETIHVTVRQHAKLYASLGAEYAFLFCQPDNGEGSTITRSYECPISLARDAFDWLLSASDTV